MKALITCISFFLLSFTGSEKLPKLETGLYKITNKSVYRLTWNKRVFYIEANPVSLLKNFKSVTVTPIQHTNKQYELIIKLDKDGAIKLENATTIKVGGQQYLGIVITGKLETVSLITGKIKGGAISISGGMSPSKLQYIQKQLQTEMQHLLR